MTESAYLPRPLAVSLMASLACIFAANHIAARIAFEHGLGLLLAIICRSAVPVILLGGLLLWRRQPIRLPAGAWPWQLAFGALVAVQSLFIYSAIVRIPVALALLVVNLFPLLFVLLTWALGGARPRLGTLLIMGMILGGLAMALDVPARLEASDDGIEWGAGLGFAFGAAAVFSVALWILNNHLLQVHGPVRSLLAMLSVLIYTSLIGVSGVVPGGMSMPVDAPGWIGLGCLALLYGSGFSLLFAVIHRLDVARNAPAMNIEPVAGLIFGWLILGQALAPIQVAGALVVVSGILLLTSRKS